MYPLNPPLAGPGTRIADCDKKKMADAILKCQNQSRPDCLQMPETEDFEAKRLKHFVGPDTCTFFELLHGRNQQLAFLTKRVQKWSPVDQNAK